MFGFQTDNGENPQIYSSTLIRMYQLRITIEGITPPIWRQVEVSENYSFYKLHHIIQKIFGWTNSHIWCFLHEGVDAPITNPWLWGGGTTRWDKTIKLKALLRKEGDSILYEYDQGDSWKHLIVLEKADGLKITKPLCVDGKRAGPPEDCGGVGGYGEMIHHLHHPEKDGYLELLEWLGAEYDPEAFDIAAVNRNLKSLNFFIRLFDEENGLIFSDPMKKNKRPPSIQISEKDVELILQEDYPYFREIVASNVFCSHCTDQHKTVGIKEYTIILNDLNDIQLSGKCSICDGAVGRYCEYGEDPEFLMRAEAFRNTHRSRKSMKVVKKRNK